MISAEHIFTAANILFTIGTSLLFIKVIRNRIRLHDFDFTGSILTTVALILMLFGYHELKMFISILFLMPTLLFWAVVSVYSGKNIKREVK